MQSAKQALQIDWGQPVPFICFLAMAILWRLWIICSLPVKNFDHQETSHKAYSSVEWIYVFLPHDLRVVRVLMGVLKHIFHKILINCKQKSTICSTDIQYACARPATWTCCLGGHYWDYSPGTISYSQVTAYTNVHSSGAGDAVY